MQRVFGITGWKNSGKTTLTERLVAELTWRGWLVSTVKHAHHGFEIDKPGTDSHRHREAGAHEVAVVSGTRWALMHELRHEEEPPLDGDPGAAVALRHRHRRRLQAGDAQEDRDPAARCAGARRPLSERGSQHRGDRSRPRPTDETLPVFDLNDIPAIADFVEAATALSGRANRSD